MRYHLLEISDYNPEAFRPEAGKMRLYGGKSDPPPPPDYRAAAQETAIGNREAAEYATKANRINQYTPYGNLTYDYTPEYDSSGQETGAGWKQTLNLAPEAQRALDQQLALNTKYGEVANIGFDRARGIFENPELDISGLPQRAIDVGQTAQQAILSRLNPQLQQQDEALRTRLANQGIGLGSEAYNREMALQSQRSNDLQMQAALQGINLDQANRSAALQEQAYMQDRPLNLINALRSGNQVQAPQFQQFAQQATTSGPDMLAATQAQYNAGVEAANASNAQSSGALSGLFGVGMGIASLPVAGAGPGMFGGSLGGNALAKWSDIRLKTNIKRIGTHSSGVGIYEYDYVWGGGKQIGVMAQEVEKVVPDAVFEVGGFKAVNYARL
jgi:hypothetical protein